MLGIKERENFDIDPVIKFCYDYILPISKDRVLATHGGEISLITKDGEILTTHDSIEVPTYMDFDNAEFSEEDNCYVAKTVYIDDYLIYLDNELWGLLDYDGNIVLEACYNNLKFSDANNIEVG